MSHDEQAVLAEEVGAFVESLKDPDARARYTRLLEAIRRGAVPPDLVAPLEAMLELVLQTQRVRLQHGPAAEHQMLALFGRTAHGAALKEAAQDVNQALRVLSGQTLLNISVQAGPGRHTLAIATERCQLRLKIDRHGIRVENVEVTG